MSESQERKVLKFFASHAGSFTPWEVREAVMPDEPITSVRRAITNLTDKGLLARTNVMKTGPAVAKGRPSRCWALSVTKTKIIRHDFTERP